jgi:hypothetical protein
MNPRQNYKGIGQHQLRATRIWAALLAEFSSQTTPKLLRITRTVENRQNGECSVFGGEIYVVTGKPPQTNLPSLLTNLRETFRIGLRTLQSTLEIQTELLAQTRTLLFIPNDRLIIFGTGNRSENEPETHFQPKRLLTSALTRSQGIPSCGLASNSATRRSSSAASSGVRSGSYPSSATISQKSCASLILSSCGRAFAASRISVAFMSVIYRDALELQADNDAHANAGIISFFGRVQIVAQVSNPRRVERGEHRRLQVGRPLVYCSVRRDRAIADWKSAIRQTRSLRYKSRDARAKDMIDSSP